MDFGKLLVNAIVVLLILIAFTFVGAITFPVLPSANNSLDVYLRDFVLLLLPVLVLALIGFFLGRGIRSLKNSFEALGLAYVSALIIGGILALFTLFNFPYTAHINLAWLAQGSWYGPWLTIFLIGAPIMLAFIV